MFRKSFLPAYGQFRDEDFSGDEMTGICLEESDSESLLLEKIKKMHNDGDSLEEIKKQLADLKLEASYIDQITANLAWLSIRPKLTS